MSEDDFDANAGSRQLSAVSAVDPRFRKPRLNPVEASDYLATVHGTPVAVTTLAKWRCLTSDGPRFAKFGRSVTYTSADLDAWVAGRLKILRSTSDGHAA